MSGLGFLGIFFVLSIVGSVVVWLRHRQPKHVVSSVDEFKRGMDALNRPPSRTRNARPVPPLDESGRGR